MLRVESSPTPGGLALQTQFWSTWTGLEKKRQKLPNGIHGLGPLNNIVISRANTTRHDSKDLTVHRIVVSVYKGPGVDTFIEQFGRQDQLTYSERIYQ